MVDKFVSVVGVSLASGKVVEEAGNAVEEGVDHDALEGEDIDVVLNTKERPANMRREVIRAETAIIN